jgi:demethylmenaquinone methyltransferase/2-methoxy-6-polyprenyl-1,4-benzoquinol methylase
VSSSLLAYYAKRADEYERIYQKPERQADLSLLKQYLQDALAGHAVLELACGTGYWTETYAPVSRSVLATDLSPEVLAIAEQKEYPPGRVRFARADAYDLSEIPGSFTGVFAGFWWSHVPRQRLGGFLRQLHRRLEPGTRCVFCDNRYVLGSSTPVHRRDSEGNSYQLRRLQDGAEYEVLKNFPTTQEVQTILQAESAVDVRTTELTYYWAVSYLTGSANLQPRSD